METALATTEQLTNTQNTDVFSLQGFEHAQRVALMLSKSSLIPKEYQGNVQNTMIALEMAHRIGASPLMVMQNLYVVHGKPSWSSSFIIGALNKCGRFSPLRFILDGEGENYGCVAWAYGKDGEKLFGPRVTRKMAKSEGWSTRNGSKWNTMEDLMFHYRSAAFFGRLYAPDILMGMQTMEETIDVQAPVTIEEKKVDKEAERIELLINNAKTVGDLNKIINHVKEDQMELFNSKLNALKNELQ